MIQLPFKPSHQISLGLLCYGYAILLSGAYTFGFWRPFGFNPFPYLTAHEVITSPLSNLLILLAPFILLIPIGLFDQSNRAKDLKSFRIMLYVHWLFYLGLIIESLYLAWSNGFNYRDEGRMLTLTVLMVFLSYGLARRYQFEPRQNYFPVICIVFSQLALVLIAGYLEGKKITADSGLIENKVEVYVLKNAKLCSNINIESAQWLYLDRYGDYTIFYNRTNRNLCFSDSKNYSLIPINIKLRRVSL